MQKQAKVRVIWRHPQGRFEVQETEHYSAFDHCTYYTRKCVFTPQDDLRGLCSSVPAYVVPEAAKQEGRRVPRVTDEERRQFVEMYRCGMPLRAIAKETGRSQKTISDALEERGCRMKPQRNSSVHWTREEVQKAVSMRKRGYLMKEIGAVLGKSSHAVQNKLAKEVY